MIKILLISHSYPPLLTSNSIQVGRWTDEASKSGDISFSVITVSPRHTAEQAGLPGNAGSPGLTVHRTFSLEKLFIATRLKGLIGRLNPSALSKPDFQSLWIPFAEAETAKLTAGAKFDLVMSCSHYITNHLIALKLKKKTGIRWIACFSDPWTESIYFREAGAGQGAWAKRIEREIVDIADAITVPSREMGSLFSRNHGGGMESKLHEIPHCYDRALIDSIEPERDSAESNEIRVVHTGSFYGKRTPLPFLDALAALRGSSFFGRLRCLFVGADRAHYGKAVRDRGLDDCVNFTERVSYHRSISHMKSARLLLLIDAPCSGSDSVFFPSKLADYLGTGLPIAGLTPAGSCSDRILTASGHRSADINSREESAVKLGQIFADIDNAAPCVPPGQYSIKSVTAQWTALIREMAGRR